MNHSFPKILCIAYLDHYSTDNLTPSSKSSAIALHPLLDPPCLPLHLAIKLEHVGALERADSVLPDTAVSFLIRSKDIAAAITLGLSRRISTGQDIDFWIQWDQLLDRPLNHSPCTGTSGT